MYYILYLSNAHLLRESVQWPRAHSHRARHDGWVTIVGAPLCLSIVACVGVCSAPGPSVGVRIGARVGELVMAVFGQVEQSELQRVK